MLALVIDDSRALRTILRRLLVECGFEVVEAADGQEALDLVTTGPVPELALVDATMPVMDGLAFVTAVRARPELARMALVMVTADSEQSQIARARAAGADAHLVKPLPDGALAERLRALGLMPSLSAAGCRPAVGG